MKWLILYEDVECYTKATRMSANSQEEAILLFNTLNLGEIIDIWKEEAIN